MLDRFASHFMVIPRSNPWKSSMRQLKIQITTICRVSLSEIIKRVNHTLRLGHSADRCAISIVAIPLILIDIVSKMNDIIHTILSNRVAVSIKVTERVIRTIIHSHVDLVDFIVVHFRRRLGPAERAFVVAIAYVELVEISSVGLEISGFDFHGVVDVAGSVSFAA